MSEVFPALMEKLRYPKEMEHASTPEAPGTGYSRRDSSLLTLECPSSDTAGVISRILQTLPYRDSVFSDRLPVQTTVAIFPQYPGMDK